MHLKRFKKALTSIVKCDESHRDEMLKLVNEQKLFADALNYFKNDTDIFKVNFPLQQVCSALPSNFWLNLLRLVGDVGRTHLNYFIFINFFQKLGNIEKFCRVPFK